MAAADPSEVTGAPNTLVQVVDAAVREEVLIRNHSGADVELFFGSDAQPFDLLAGSPASDARMSITGSAASLEVKARCRTAPLTLWVTEITA